MTIEERPQELEKFAKAKKLDEQLERSGAYEKITDPRRVRLLKTYLSSEVTFTEAGKTLDKPVTKQRVSQLLYSGMRQAFSYLDELTRQEYGTPEAALQTRTQANFEEVRRRGQARFYQSYREGTYTGKPLGGRREPGIGKKIGRPRTAR